ncbi:Methyltransferase domain-containing protein [Paenibacillus sp. yr247]|uniref:class I SAM-dependent methyltransferase n=1 Tax=Paenibacillus sp. yr247 TaxID=1761880 RepID=UPI0008924735|nr:methyltransferase domain-containing protein [Paenibacillus sp. yr247]SDP26637.1 Methyltransferase domain-containing protein [Paenibacillus sp. yr247]
MESKRIIDRAYDFADEQQKALDEGAITEHEWYEMNKSYFTEHYLSADNPRSQSGHGGDEEQYFHNHFMLLDTITKNGSFIDVGCANGYLIESINKWINGMNTYQLDFYGLDISHDLIELAKTRLPNWKDKLYTGNAIEWVPEKKFDFVCVKELGYVPDKMKKTFFEHLYNNFVDEEGRLILGPYSEEKISRELEEQLSSWGYFPSGYIERSHNKSINIARIILYFNK